MHRCIQLARLGAGRVAPNPMVGAVLLHRDEIIGEGYHQAYGGPHAEVNALANVPSEKKSLISSSTLYVSLEPCVHFGKTPPCTDLIISNHIPEVVIGATDVYDKVSGKGIQKLREAGVRVRTGVLEDECLKLNKQFFTFQEKKRPYIILKWAQSADGKISAGTPERTIISNVYTQMLVHRWRSEVAGILAGYQTVLLDNPQLTNRFWGGRQPHRIVLDRNAILPGTRHIFDGKAPTLIINEMKSIKYQHTEYLQINFDSLLEEMLPELYRREVQSILVEGGAKTFSRFIEANLWDECRVITNTEMRLPGGIDAPEMPWAQLISRKSLGSDVVAIYQPHRE